MSATVGSVIDSASSEEAFTSVPLAVWSDGSTVHSVVVCYSHGIIHEYRVCRCGQLLARLPSLAAVEEWRLHHTVEIPDVLGLEPAA
jgi:hypothetical protein